MALYLLKTKYTILILSVIALLGTLFLPHTIRATTISPVRIELKGDPGQTLTSEFKVYNDGTKASTYYIGFQNFEAKDELGQPQFTFEKKDLATWISAKSQVVVEPKTWETIPLTITIPRGVEPGGYFAGAFASPTPPNGNDANEVYIDADTGTLVLLQVSGNFTEGADILEFKTKDNKKSFLSLPVDFYYRFQNSGKSWQKPLGDIVIKNGFGKTSKIISANPGGNNVLPESIRRFEVSWLSNTGEETQKPDATRPSPPKEGFWNKVVYEWKNFAFGRYTAQLTLTYGQDQTKTQAKMHFWVMPWHLIAVVGAGLLGLIIAITIIVVIIVYMVFKRKSKK